MEVRVDDGQVFTLRPYPEDIRTMELIEPDFGKAIGSITLDVGGVGVIYRLYDPEDTFILSPQKIIEFIAQAA